VTKTLYNILFVDDDAEMRSILCEQLGSIGFRVDEAADGNEAMKKLKKGGYDLLLLDITLPGTNGMEILRFVKDRSLPCRVIMLTGIVGLSFAIESLRLGAADYITKPYDLDYLISTIKRVLEMEPSEQ
jgi:two-component system nitrogen regulation response regulator NtrX